MSGSRSETPAGAATADRARTLGAETWDEFRPLARRLLADGVPPDAIDWVTDRGQPCLFPQRAATPAREDGPADSGAPVDPPRVPRRFVSLGRRAACHRDPERFSVLYRLLWRLAHGEPHLLEVSVDPDVDRLERLARQVKRDEHKMKAFVRFRRVDDPDGERFVAWHRPDHRIVERVAPFFAERFGDQRWAILTPDRSVAWDGDRLAFGPGAPRDAAPESDELEGLWRTYYRSIFNPARIKLRAMRAELPVRHWATLPETRDVADMLRDAPARLARMTAPPPRPPAASFLPGSRDLPALAAAIRACSACGLCERASGPVFGEGSAGARWMLVGEQPGDREDREGRPFVGPAGQVLAEALAEAGLDRAELYLTNAVKAFKWRPGETATGRDRVRRIHQTPNWTEVSSCAAWLEAEIEAVRPRLLVALGATAARSLLGPQLRFTDARGALHASRFDVPVLPTYHPSALLRMRDPAQRAAARSDLVAHLAAAAAAIGSPSTAAPSIAPGELRDRAAGSGSRA